MLQIDNFQTQTNICQVLSSDFIWDLEEGNHWLLPQLPWPYATFVFPFTDRHHKKWYFNLLHWFIHEIISASNCTLKIPTASKCISNQAIEKQEFGNNESGRLFLHKTRAEVDNGGGLEEEWRKMFSWVWPRLRDDMKTAVALLLLLWCPASRRRPYKNDAAHEQRPVSLPCFFSFSFFFFCCQPASFCFPSF